MLCQISSYFFFLQFKYSEDTYLICLSGVSGGEPEDSFH